MITALSHRPRSGREVEFTATPQRRIMTFCGENFLEAFGRIDPGDRVNADGVPAWVIFVGTKADEPEGPVRCIVQSLDGRSKGVFTEGELMLEVAS